MRLTPDVNEYEVYAASNVAWLGLAEADWANVEMDEKWNKKYSWFCAASCDTFLKSINDREDKAREDVNKETCEDWDPEDLYIHCYATHNHSWFAVELCIT